MKKLFYRQPKDKGKGVKDIKDMSDDGAPDELARRLAGMNVVDRNEHPHTPTRNNQRVSNSFVGGFRQSTSRIPDEELANTSDQLKSPAKFHRPSASAPGVPSFPAPTQYGQAYPHPRPLPNPPSMAMPIPQHASGIPQGQMSLTMQHAIAGDNGLQYTPQRPATQSLYPPQPTLPPRPHSDPAVPTAPKTPRRPSISQPQSPSTSAKPSPQLDTPGKARRRIVSTPASPSAVSASGRSNSAGLSVICSGITQQGNPCKNKVKVETLPLGLHDPDVEEEMEFFCYHHNKGSLETTHIDINNKELRFDDFVQSYLLPSSRATLRRVMVKAKSDKDTPGYIYCFRVRDPSNPDLVRLKVGRTTKLSKRISEWSIQCGKEPMLKGWWPAGMNAQPSDVMKGTVDPGLPDGWIHRLETLIHIELADLSLNAPYLEKEFPNVTFDKDVEKYLKKGKLVKANETCPTCGTRHREIFSFPRLTGHLEGKEWEYLVKPVIEKWARFVRQYLQ
ncbi:Meiosis-associated regulatory protein [Abortiporus biennis]